MYMYISNDGLGDTPLRWQHELSTLLKAPPVQRCVIWVWSGESETGKSSYLSHLQARCGEAALKFPQSEQYGWQHLLRDHTQLILLDISRADTEDLDALTMPSGQMGQNSFGSVTYSPGGPRASQRACRRE